MASSTTADHPAKKAGYWFSTFELQVADIKSNHFTHLYAGFAKVQYPIPPHQKNDDVIKFPDNSGRFESFSETVKGTNPRVKALLSIGGDEGPNISSAIASVARDAKLREAFINRSIQLARENKYDGLDLCWLYPSNAEQMHLFALLLEEWRQAINDEKAKQTNNYEKLLLTAAVFHQPVIHGTDGNNIDYPCQAISKYLDWINVLTIDFDTPSPSNSPGKTGPVDAWLSCGKAGIDDWIKREAPTENLVLGLPFHGYNHGNGDPNDIAAKVKEAFRGINLGGYFAWHLASDDNWTSQMQLPMHWLKRLIIGQV
ncbi:class V chitinase-like [Carya illinoinensis]|uniref:class V chitinase-like n=1 Tax=Carya illinoinensis TaxID=32201 RepID=UPI001C71EE59|nr:class V chitinase-like [Carya illinoinensis]